MYIYTDIYVYVHDTLNHVWWGKLYEYGKHMCTHVFLWYTCICIRIRIRIRICICICIFVFEYLYLRLRLRLYLYSCRM